MATLEKKQNQLNRNQLKQSQNQFKQFINKFGHRKFYAFCGFILAQGAPFGYFLHTYFFSQYAESFSAHVMQLWQTQTLTMIYIWGGTTLFFTLFGWLVGEYASKLYWQNQSLNHSLLLLEKFEGARRKLFFSMSAELKTPAVTAQEFLIAFSQGELGIASAEQQQMAKAATAELSSLNKTLDKLFTVFEKQQNGMERTSVWSLAKEICQKTKANLHFTASQAAVLWIEPSLLTETVVELFLHLKRVQPKNELHFTVENAASENYVDHPFLYLVVESRGHASGEGWQSDWTLAQNTIEWLGGHAWFDTSCTTGVKLYLAFPEAHAIHETSEEKRTA